MQIGAGGVPFDPAAGGQPITGTTITATTKFLAADGTVGAPGYAFSSAPDTGLYISGGTLAFARAGSIKLNLYNSGVQVNGYLDFGSGDAIVSRYAAKQLMISGDGSTLANDTGLVTGFLSSAGANGQSGAVTYLSELVTIAAAATTDTTIQMPAGAIVVGVSVRVTTVIPTATNFTVGDSGSAARFSTAAVSVAANSTDKGTKAGCYYNASALAVRITPDGTPGDNSGRVRVTIHFIAVTAPTS